MTPSTKSTLPQTGSAGMIEKKMLESDPRPGLKEISYKRYFTRSTQDFEDSVRVMLFTEPYLKLNARAQAESDTQINYDELYATNLKIWVTQKTCFDFELNSNTDLAGKAQSWTIDLETIAEPKKYSVDITFDKDYLVSKNNKWFQYTGIICAKEKLNPLLGLRMVLTPSFRENKSIILKWEVPESAKER